MKYLAILLDVFFGVIDIYLRIGKATWNFFDQGGLFTLIDYVFKAAVFVWVTIEYLVARFPLAHYIAFALVNMIILRVLGAYDVLGGGFVDLATGLFFATVIVRILAGIRSEEATAS